MTAACGGDAPQPPVACGTIPQQTLTVGEEVMLVPCFEDPEMGLVTLTAESSNPEVAPGRMIGEEVLIAGRSPGAATITVTATDPDMLTAELDIEVVVPNRPPELRGEIQLDAVHLDSTVQVVLSEHFHDPDGQELTYAAMSSDPRVASIDLSVDTLAVTAVSPGTVTVTVTATDPGGLSATAQVGVRVYDNGPPVANPRYSQLIYTRTTSRVYWGTVQDFSDPDDDSLVYSAVSSDGNVVTAGMSRDTIVNVNIRGLGVATVTVTATDPYGLSATYEVVFKIVPNSLPFRDDFESDESLAGWAVHGRNATTAFGDGMVRVTTPNDTTERFAMLRRPIITRDWTLRARMGNATEDSWVQLTLWTYYGEHPVYTFGL